MGLAHAFPQGDFGALVLSTSIHVVAFVVLSHKFVLVDFDHFAHLSAKYVVDLEALVLVVDMVDFDFPVHSNATLKLERDLEALAYFYYDSLFHSASMHSVAEMVALVRVCGLFGYAVAIACMSD